MDTLKTNCRICKKVKAHTQITEFDPLPFGVVCLMCTSCGVMGIVSEDDIKVEK